MAASAAGSVVNATGSSAVLGRLEHRARTGPLMPAVRQSSMVWARSSRVGRSTRRVPWGATRAAVRAATYVLPVPQAITTEVRAVWRSAVCAAWTALDWCGRSLIRGGGVVVVAVTGWPVLSAGGGRRSGDAEADVV